MILQKCLTAFLSGPLLVSTGDHSPSCNAADKDHQSSPEISRYWGQYSPYFAVDSTISTAIPSRCSVTFAQVLSRHGARSPTSSKTKSYSDTISKIQRNSVSYAKKIAFLQNLTYTLGADQLTVFGEQELYNSGHEFFDRYASLANSNRLFVRASGQTRVVRSAQNFTQGFNDAMKSKTSSRRGADYPYDIVIISEADGSNNTLNHGLCTNFETEEDDMISGRGQASWMSTFASPIRKRLNNLLPGVNLTLLEAINMMDLCPFYTVDDPDGTIDWRFCSLFTLDEWKQYDYYQSLGKYYHYGGGDPLGPSQGIGWTNELISRLTHEPVQDQTSMNRTLDSNSDTFPIGPDDVLFADFTHDNAITAVLFALGLYNSTTSLDSKVIQEAGNVGGYSASWTVPFASRLYVEKMVCDDDDGAVDRQSGHNVKNEYIRFLVNDRVVPLSCSDDDGKCRLRDYLSTLQFAKSGGHWAQCFT